ncbi:MAG: glycosyltransferase [Deltaproteobacteria bacterium]|nr:glycosyltransferase [Deltaproteobacteria bacterium]
MGATLETAPLENPGSHRIRLLHLVNHLGLGGTERQLFLALKHLDRQRFENHVVVFNQSQNVVYDDELASLGIRVWTVPPSCRGVPRRSAFLFRLFRQLHPQVVHSWSFHDNPYSGVIGRLAGCPVRWGSLRGSLLSPGLQRLPWLLRALALHSVSAQISNCHALRDQLEAAGVPARKLLVLPNCVERAEENLPVDLSAAGIAANDLLVGIVGNLRRVKNQLFFLRAMARLLPHRPEAKAVLIGQPIASEPDMPQRLEQEINRLGLGKRVKMLGFRSDVPQLLPRLAVVCLTSHSEGMPNALLEAMAAGRPTVAVRVGGVPEVVRHGTSGLLVEPGDEAGFAAAVGQLLDDEELRRRMGQEGLRLARQEHGCAVIASRLGKLYEQALGKEPREIDSRPIP